MKAAYMLHKEAFDHHLEFTGTFQHDCKKSYVSGKFLQEQSSYNMSASHESSALTLSTVLTSNSQKQNH